MTNDTVESFFLRSVIARRLQHKHGSAIDPSTIKIYEEHESRGPAMVVTVYCETYGTHEDPGLAFEYRMSITADWCTQ